MKERRTIIATPARALQSSVTDSLTSLAVLLIRCYQAMIRPHLIGSCKFHPTCSEYGIEALHTHGFWRGSVLTFRRVCRCVPFTAGGLDPVPPRPQEGGAPV